MPVTCGRRSRLRARTDGRGALGQIDDAAGNADVDQQVAETTQVGRTPGFERVDYGIGDHHEAHVRHGCRSMVMVRRTGIHDFSGQSPGHRHFGSGGRVIALYQIVHQFGVGHAVRERIQNSVDASLPISGVGSAVTMPVAEDCVGPLVGGSLGRNGKKLVTRSAFPK